jgi:hypothetical protein
VSAGPTELSEEVACIIFEKACSLKSTFKPCLAALGLGVGVGAGLGFGAGLGDIAALLMDLSALDG